MVAPAGKLIAIDAKPLARDFLKTVPELVFEADTRFVARNDD
jgi:hypothetical protein